MYYKKTTFLILLCCWFFSGFAQDKRIDSLLTAARTERNDTSRIKLYLKVASGYLRQGVADSVFVYSRKSYSLSKQKKYLRGLSTACNFLGQAHGYVGAPDSAIQYFKEALDHYKQLGDVKREAGMLNNLGIIYKDEGNISRSLNYYFDALRMKEFLKDSDGIASVYTNIGHVYSDARDTVNTLKYHRMALELRRKLNDQSGICVSLMSLGLYYQNARRFDLAISYLQEALKLSETLNEEESIAISSYNLALVYYQQHKLEECEALFQRSLDLSRKNKNYKGVASCLEMLGQMNLDKGDTKQAISQLEEAYALSKEIDVKDLIANCGFKLSKAYEMAGDFEKAYLYSKAAYALHDSLFNAENVRKLTSEGLKYEHEKEKMLIQKEQDKKEAIAKADAFKKNLIIGVSVLILVIISFFSYTLSKKLKENRRQKSIIEEQRNEIIASINYAKRIQDAMLINADLKNPAVPENFILFRPKDIVSGDFYWSSVTGNYFYIAVCDCTGHGVPGAFLSLLSINFLNEAVNEKGIAEPHEILNYVRDHLVEKMEGSRDGMDAVIIRLPLKRGAQVQMDYAAANNAPVLVHDQQVEKLPRDKMPVGQYENMRSFTAYSRELKQGDMLYLYTDGYADQFGGPKGKKFKLTQLDALLLKNSQIGLPQQQNRLLAEFDHWKRNLDQVDDVCIVGLRL